MSENNKTPVAVEVLVHADPETVWRLWNEPQAIKSWYHASDDWGVGEVENDLCNDGRFSIGMMALDGSISFNLAGIYTDVQLHSRVEYTLDDGRNVVVIFSQEPDAIRIVETFEPEKENTVELQRAGWQAILDNFKKYAESYS